MSMPALIATGTAPSSWATLAGRLARAADRRSLADPLFGEWLDRCLAEGAAIEPGQARPAMERWLNGRKTLPTGLDLRACWAVDTIDRELGSARYLVFADSPVDALCAWLQSGAEGSPREALQRWGESVRAILRLVQRQGPRCLLLSTAEARRDPQTLAEAANDWLGRPELTLLAADAAQVASEADPLARAIAALLVQADGAARQLWQQLHACTVPLCADAGEAADSELGFNLRRDLAPGPALARYRELTAAMQALGGELEQSRRASEAAEQALQERLAAPAVNPATQAALDDLRQENGLLLLQLQQVQEELEHYVFENRKLQDRRAAAAPAAVGAATLEALDVGPSQDPPPHRGLDLVARNLRHGQRCFARLRLRLVEHLGRPGLAVFGAGPDEMATGDAALFSTWSKSGQEDGQAFMLIVPSDHAARDLLLRLPRTDWELLEGLVAEIGRHLRGSQRAALAGWAAVAQRLQHQLGELPPRLRYDDLEVDVSGSGKEARIRARFRKALFGARRFERIELRWQPTAPPVLELLLPAGDTLPPLSNWPVTEQGQPAASWRLPVGAGLSAQKARDWASLSAGDRDLLLALCDALPGVPQRLPAGDSAGISRQALDTQARRLLPEARRHALGLLRLTAERVLRLLRQ
jgi:hypothetical protein